MSRRLVSFPAHILWFLQQHFQKSILKGEENMFEPVCNPLHQSLLSCQGGKKGPRIMFSNSMSTVYASGIYLKISDGKCPFFLHQILCFLFNWKKKKSITGIQSKLPGNKQPEKLPITVKPACDQSTQLLNFLQSRSKSESLLSPYKSGYL